MAGLLEAYPTTHLWLVVLLLLGVLWICLKGATGTRKVPATGFPVIKLKSNDMEPGIIEGSKLYPDQPYEIQVPAKQMIILPRKYLDEIKRFPESQMSFKALVKDAMAGEYTMIATHDHSLVTALRRDLTQNIVHAHELLQEEAISVVKTKLGFCGNGSHVFMLWKVLTIGIKLGCILKYTEDAFKAGMILHMTPSIIHPLLNMFLPQLWAVRRHYATVKRLVTAYLLVRLLKPILEERIEKLKDPAYKPPRDMIQSFININPQKGMSLDFQATNQLMAAFTSMHTTSMNACHALFHLAAAPEHVAPLREEIETVLAEEGGLTSKAAMQKLRKLDSFLRETQRLNPSSFVGMERKVLVTTKLSDGTVLPAGSILGFDSFQINYDTQLWENPEKFDGFRFARLRAADGNDHKYQATSIGLESLSFGLGTHACPGRFFAINETKILLAHLIMNYDWAFPDGQGRPKNFTLISALLINPESEVLCRRRQ
ncbi:cytochrome P450 oxidoreductase GliF [Trichophyton benhamiae CBS 112371]|uniref:Cytochrome P450 oxidoreductase GliF n=1 Tax=Arthroderma benhamiae (strain ATCC MYA-4681 / CBS 112371) TaxID=663331 RepID=D4ANT9_ARTBC|nr:cytochrome P450 oxidoreductase GliF [Trichophyton benhamiae CBS 112371]EFE34950.1 cytochrome P450 oxidoreductase GliF [Trichophyton benhamiae CBS 112371]